MAAAALPGPQYREVLRWIHELLQPPTYIEIGVWKGDSLRIAGDQTTCLGIDPHPLIEERSPRTRVFAMTSDEFFERESLPSLLSGPHFALAFIDGMHVWEQALRDFLHLELYAGAGSVILIHDCIPLDEATSERTRSTGFYTGDVWKLPLCLRENRPDLRIAIVRTAPTGLCLVTNLDPANRVLTSRYQGLVDGYTPLIYADYEASLDRMPPSVPNKREAIATWLEAAGAMPERKRSCNPDPGR